MQHSDMLSIYETATGFFSVAMLANGAVLFWLQMRTYRRTRHRSLELLLLSTGVAFGEVLLSMAARHYWQSSPLGLYLFLFSLPVAALQMGLGLYGTAKLLGAFEEQVLAIHGTAPNNSSKPTPLRGAA